MKYERYMFSGKNFVIYYYIFIIYLGIYVLYCRETDNINLIKFKYEYMLFKSIEFSLFILLVLCDLEMFPKIKFTEI